MSAGAALNLATLTEDDRAEMRAMQAEERLIDFIRLMWPSVEPQTEYLHGWPLEALCEHLEAVAAGEITRLIINVPPGFMKSLATCVFLPAWIWGPRGQPHHRFLCASYTSSLTERDNLRTLQVVKSELYQRHWGRVYRMENEGVGKLLNNKTGWKLATSVGGVGTGERGSILLIDDPNSVKQAESQTVRDSTNQWLMEVLPTRLSDPRRSAIVVIQQRTHEEDATGTLLKAELGYEHLMIPMEWDGRRYHTVIGWTDPRTVEDIEPGRNDRAWWAVRGELAFADRFPAWVVERDKKTLGTYASAGQFQQAPEPRGGGIIKREWWQRWEPTDVRKPKFPPFDVVVGFYDGAHTEKTQNDPGAMSVLGTFTDPMTGMPKVMLVKCWAERLALNDAVKRINETCLRCGVSILLVENKATGYSVVQELQRLFVGKPYSITLTDPRGSVMGRGGYDKVARAMSVVPIFEDEVVYAPCVMRLGDDGRSTGESSWTDWAEAAIDECAVFPRGSHDDRVDTIVGALRWMRDAGMLMREVEAVEAEREAVAGLDEAGRQMPLYRT